jgi:hypothetical protein
MQVLDRRNWPKFIEVFLEDNKLFYRPVVDAEKSEGVLPYENSQERTSDFGP